MARPPHKRTEDNARVVLEAARTGMRAIDIGPLIGIKDCRTLRAHYAEELYEGISHAKKHVTEKLMDKINKGNVTSIIFYLKTRCGWKEPERGEYPIEAEIPVKDVSSVESIIDFRESVIKNVSEGDLSPADASYLSQLLRDQDNAIDKKDVAELRSEIEELKNLIISKEG